ncbi:MAG: 16S rRNA (uracil(1498)-N(3))-methyltransferase [Parasporobacterium sp.]|nr:16S rRNA (uracil(1498)-N(3))-methyltransferase [Parasporobacterium sp.]
MYHFFAEPENITEDRVYIYGQDVNHMKNVLRIRTGEEVLISDGSSRDYTCSVSSISETEIVCDIMSSEISANEPSCKFFLFQGMPKSDKLEHIIQKSVELGVYEIIPVDTKRCIAKYDAKKQKSKTERWQKIAESAAKQSRRGIIPRVHDIMAFKDAVAYAAGLDLVLIPYENYKDIRTTREIINGIMPGMSVGIFVGPEGGFDPDEVERVCALPDSGGASAKQISLGSRILRTETAPLMLLSVLMFNLEGSDGG